MGRTEPPLHRGTLWPKSLEAEPQVDTGTPVRPIAIPIPIVRSAITVGAIVGSVIGAIISVSPITRTIAVSASIPITNLLNVSNVLGVRHW